MLNTYDIINNKQDRETQAKQTKIIELEQELESMKESEKNIKFEKARAIEVLQREIEKAKTEKEEENKSNKQRIEEVWSLFSEYSDIDYTQRNMTYTTDKFTIRAIEDRKRWTDCKIAT